MKCNNCGSELRIGTEQVDVDSKGLPVIHRFGYCDNCRTKWDLDINIPNGTPNHKRSSDLSTISLALGITGLFLVFIVIGIIPAIVGLIFGIIALVNKKPHKGRAITGIVLCSLATLMFIVLLSGTDSSNSDIQESDEQMVQKNENNNDEERRMAQEEKAKKEAEKKKQEEQSNNLTVGSTFEENGLKITVNEANTDFQDYDNEYGWNTPEDGMKYIMVSFTFDNTGKSDEYVSIYDFDCYADNTTMEQVYSLDDSGFVNTNLSPGRNISFKTYYAVPVNSQSIELEYETNMWTEEKVIIKLQ